MLTILAFITLSSTLVVVYPHQIATKHPFVQKEKIGNRQNGWLVKVPFYQKAYIYDRRAATWDGRSRTVHTHDHVFLEIFPSIDWQIIDPELFRANFVQEKEFLKAMEDVSTIFIKQQIEEAPFSEILRSGNHEHKIAVDDEIKPFLISLDSINDGRAQIEREIQGSLGQFFEGQGVKIWDFRFRRIGLLPKTRKKRFEKNIRHRKNIAAQYRSETKEILHSLRGDEERKVKEMEIEAREKANRILVSADSTVQAIENGTLNGNKEAKEFYLFLKSMQLVKKSMTSQTKIILSTEDDLYKALKEVE